MAGAGSHRLFHLRARNVMEKQQWLHTLSPLRFPEIPEAVPKEGKQPSCIIGVVFTRSVIIDNNIGMIT